MALPPQSQGHLLYNPGHRKTFFLSNHWVYRKAVAQSCFLRAPSEAYGEFPWTGEKLEKRFTQCKQGGGTWGWLSGLDSGALVGILRPGQARPHFSGEGMRVEALGQHQVSRGHGPAWPAAAGEHLSVHLRGTEFPCQWATC